MVDPCHRHFPCHHADGSDAGSHRAGGGDVGCDGGVAVAVGSDECAGVVMTGDSHPQHCLPVSAITPAVAYQRHRRFPE